MGAFHLAGASTLAQGRSSAASSPAALVVWSVAP